jgi:hypothetical protein
MRYLHYSAILGALVSAPIIAEVVADDTRLLKVQYSDGAVETYSVHYVANFSSEIHEEGHPSIPLRGWLTDTRQCHWSFNGSIDRQACLVNHGGRTICPAELSRVYHDESAQRGAGGWSFAQGVHPENCGEARPRAQQDVESHRQALINQMPAIIQQDREVLRSQLSQDAQIVSLTETH